jgi:amino acid permease
MLTSPPAPQNYYWSWAITIPVELVAGSLLISYWDPNTSAAAYITPLWVTMIVINLAGVRW